MTISWNIIWFEEKILYPRFFSKIFFRLFSCFLSILWSMLVQSLLPSNHILILEFIYTRLIYEDISLVFVVRFSDDNQIESSRKILMIWEQKWIYYMITRTKIPLLSFHFIFLKKFFIISKTKSVILNIMKSFLNKKLHNTYRCVYTLLKYLGNRIFEKVTPWWGMSKIFP